MTTPLLVIVAFVVVSAAVGVVGRGRSEMNVEQWSVGGRRFGVILVWLLTAGEIYTTFTFLGASGWAYSRGAPAFYILAYGTIGYIISFFLLPPVWRMAKRLGLHTQPDFFLARYDSPALTALAVLIAVVSIVPYLQLQLAGLGMIVEIASAGALSSTVAIIVAFAATCLFVYTSGIKGIAWVAIIKDLAMMVAVAVIGFGLPTMYFGGIGKMLGELMRRHPSHLTFPGTTPSMGVGWVISTILLTGVGFYCWPHTFASAFSAKDDRTLRRNAVIMPLYQLPTVLVFFVGFTALLVLPGLKNPDGALLSLVTRSYPGWFAGFVGGAGAVTAMVPAAMLLLGGSTLVAKNLYRPMRRRAVSERHLMRASRAFMLLIAALALALTLSSRTDLVKLLIFGYDGIAQLFPAIVLGVFVPRATVRHVMPGLVAGVTAVIALIWSNHDTFLGMNAGFVGLALNAAVTMVAIGAAGAPAGERRSDAAA
ncbi:MAG TPA: sodium:solute symporter family protein [Thermoanaerobaculaceae bacterium]|nr:sodium:solute symporter family protein [Thermoanaerobaculaceae bacterium]